MLVYQYIFSRCIFVPIFEGYDKHISMPCICSHNSTSMSEEKPKVRSRKRAAKFGSNRDPQARSATERQLVALHKISFRVTRWFPQKLTLARDHLQSPSRRRSNYCTCRLNALGKIYSNIGLMYRNGTYIAVKAMPGWCLSVVMRTVGAGMNGS
jgi:hypothetical protein